MKLARLVAGTILIAAATSSLAVPMTFNAVDSGTYTTGGHTPNQTGYTAGYASFFQQSFRNFFVFDFGSGIPNTVVNSATLELAPGAGAPSGTFTLWSLEGSVSDLTAGNGQYSDLGDGTAYASVNLGNNLIAPPSISINLNNAAVSALDQVFNFGGLWALGGVSTASNLGFLGTNAGGVSLRLDVEDRAAVVPSPANLSLILLGLAGLVLRHGQRVRPTKVGGTARH
ncbi:MAG: hypothetical protein AAF513_18955 [Pseudomonadota bacterium]